MQNLQNLCVTLDVKDPWWESDLLEPITKVTTPKPFFILNLPVLLDVTSHSQVNSWSTDKGLQSVDRWAQLPCTIRRISGGNFEEPDLHGFEVFRRLIFVKVGKQI